LMLVSGRAPCGHRLARCLSPSASHFPVPRAAFRASGQFLPSVAAATSGSAFSFQHFSCQFFSFSAFALGYASRYLPWGHLRLRLRFRSPRRPPVQRFSFSPFHPFSPSPNNSPASPPRGPKRDLRRDTPPPRGANHRRFARPKPEPLEASTPARL